MPAAHPCLNHVGRLGCIATIPESNVYHGTTSARVGKRYKSCKPSTCKAFVKR